MILAFTLGLTGSLGHCVGMCSAVTMLLRRHPALKDRPVGWALLHAGRLTSYAVLGVLAGAAGQILGLDIDLLRPWQGWIALIMAGLAVYFALAIIGRLPSPDRALKGPLAAWGRLMRRTTSHTSESRLNGPTRAYMLGLLWGMLPCGLVLAALFTAAASTSPLTGAARMIFFGLGTVPALAAIGWLSGRAGRLAWPKYAAAAAMMAFGVQFALRGLANWGVVEHLMLGGVMLW